MTNYRYTTNRFNRSPSESEGFDLLGLSSKVCEDHYTTAREPHVMMHDLVEHVTGVHNIGSYLHELIALGASWATRSSHGDLLIEHHMSIHDAVDSLQHSIVNVLVESVVSDKRISNETPPSDMSTDISDLEDESLTILADKAYAQAKKNLIEEDHCRIEDIEERLISPVEINFLLEYGADKIVERFGSKERAYGFCYDLVHDLGIALKQCSDLLYSFEVEIVTGGSEGCSSFKIEDISNDFDYEEFGIKNCIFYRHEDKDGFDKLKKEAGQ